MLKPAWELLCATVLFAVFFYIEHDITLSIYFMLVFVGMFTIFSSTIDLLAAAAKHLYQIYKARN